MKVRSLIAATVLVIILLSLGGCGRVELPEFTPSPSPSPTATEPEVPDVNSLPENQDLVEGAIPGEGLGVDVDEVKEIFEWTYGSRYEDMGQGQYIMSISEDAWSSLISTDIRKLYMVSYSCSAPDFTLSEDDLARVDKFSEVISGEPVKDAVLGMLEETKNDPIAQKIAEGEPAGGQEFVKKINSGEARYTLRYLYDGSQFSIEWSAAEIYGFE